MRRQWRPLFSPLDRALTLPQRWRIVAGWLPWAGDALSLLLLATSLTLTISLSLSPWQVGVAAFLFTLLGHRLAAIRKSGIRVVINGLALSHTAARAFWDGLLARAAPGPKPAGAQQLPSWTDKLLREELALLMLTWTALAGVVAVQGFATWQAILWCGVLLIQSLPYLAAVSVSALTTIRASRPLASRPSLRPVARSGAGD